MSKTISQDVLLYWFFTLLKPFCLYPACNLDNTLNWDVCVLILTTYLVLTYTTTMLKSKCNV